MDEKTSNVKRRTLKKLEKNVKNYWSRAFFKLQDNLAPWKKHMEN